jgi:8-oxo-dGTP diphosphatase/2-hydroxy-dATP diphosphatase
MTELTLTLITEKDKVLLGLKKRGFGMGKYNGFGGKIEAGETVEEAAAREVFEESNLELRNLKKIAIIDFAWQDSKPDLKVHLFHSTKFQGNIQETEEMRPEWFDIDNIPLDKMWDDDRYWFPLFLQGKSFEATFLFDKKDRVVKHQINVLA